MSYNPFLKENRKVVLLNLLSTIIWYSFSYVAKIIIEIIKGYTMPTYIIHTGFVLVILIINVWISLFLNQKTNQKLIKEQSVLNNPDLFPELNETVLKKNIAIKMQECPNNQLIRNICLYSGGGNNPYKYNVVVEINPAVGFETVQRFWGGEAPYVLGDSFVEIYREKPESILQFQKGSFWNEWDTIVVYSLDEIPNNFILKNYKWALYQM